MTEAQQGNENLATTQEQVVDDAHVTIITVMKKTEVPVNSSSHSSDLASKFLNFSDMPYTDVEIVSPLEVLVHHEVPRTQAPTFLSIPVSVIPESSPVFTNIPQPSHIFTPTPILATPTPPSTIETSNPLANLPDFSLAASALAEFELKKILLDKMEKSESYLTAPEHRECYDGLKKSYPLDQDVFYSYDVYTLKRGRKDKDKDEDHFAGSDRGLKMIKTSKDAEPTTDPKKKDSTSSSSKGTKSQPRSSGKSVQSEELVFEVEDSDMP
ncbi:hypothetical protein Tco_0816064 [Tanacetum coccineum]